MFLSYSEHFPLSQSLFRNTKKIIFIRKSLLFCSLLFAIQFKKFCSILNFPILSYPIRSDLPSIPHSPLLIPDSLLLFETFLPYARFFIVWQVFLSYTIQSYPTRYSLFLDFLIYPQHFYLSHTLLPNIKFNTKLFQFFIYPIPDFLIPFYLF